MVVFCKLVYVFLGKAKTILPILVVKSESLVVWLRKNCCGGLFLMDNSSWVCCHCCLHSYHIMILQLGNACDCERGKMWPQEGCSRIGKEIWSWGDSKNLWVNMNLQNDTFSAFRFCIYLNHRSSWPVLVCLGFFLAILWASDSDSQEKTLVFFELQINE